VWTCPVCGSMEFVMTPNGGRVQKVRCVACERTFVLNEPLPLDEGYSRNW